VNDYQPLGIRIITPKDGYTIPELLDEAKRGNIPEKLKVSRQKIYDLLDNKIPSTNPQNEAYKELLIATCNHLNTTFPFLFEKINDFTELLLPDDLTSDFSIVKDVRDGMLIEDCKNVEIIGWLYQFYISEKKDEVFASKSKVKKEDIPAATQLFTPRWIVEYMVQNTLGKLWLQNHPKSRLREHMQYFIESASLEADDYLKINSPEEIKFLDPASGSGHILVYAFDLFTRIYEEEGYDARDIPKLIIEKNLYGFEIDERAAQLTALALMIKAREYQRRIFREELEPNVLCFQDLSVTKNDLKEIFLSQKIDISTELMHDFLLMQQATNFGSLIIPKASTTEILRINNELKRLISNANVFQWNKIDNLITALTQLIKLGEKYHCVAANPPYMGGNMNEALSEFVKTYYADSKYDLMACFMESIQAMLHQRGFMGMINQQSWMFLSSYEYLRKKIIKNSFIDSLLHLGARTFPEIGGEVVQNASFVLWNYEINAEGFYLRLVDYENSETKRIKTLNAINDSRSTYLFKVNQLDFESIPSNPIGYWLSSQLKRIFSLGKPFGEVGFPKVGMQTSNNYKFLRFWFEIKTNEFLNQSQTAPKWIKYLKGGSFRRWYGNLDYLLYYNKNPDFIKQQKNATVLPLTKLKELKCTWTDLTSSPFNSRFAPSDTFHDISGHCFYPTEKNQLQLLGYTNTKVFSNLINVINSSFHFQVGDVAKIPVIELKTNEVQYINLLVNQLIEISKLDWDLRENSWDFSRNGIVSLCLKDEQEIENLYDMFIQSWQLKFFKTHQKEEEINQRFIDIYGLTEEITNNVPLEEITILHEELDRKALVKLDSKLTRDPETKKVNNYGDITLKFNSREIIAQFISYTLGCIFGRFSPEKEGLILANQGETLVDYLQKMAKTQDQCTFLPDEDNIIPILDEDWFEDDIVGKFYHFLKVTFGEKNFNKNLSFIEEQIGKDIRKYFIKDFYQDHIKRYKKRPIYWMFSSPKGSFNVLIYMHRYTPDTVSNILNKYLKEFIGKLNTRKEHLERVKETGSASDKSKAIKESDNIQKMLVELHEYERDILYPLATERIEIDLDDGVLVNYNKFGKAVKEVNGLNDPATKKKVKQFDWVDTTQIR
ncbi:MAG: BREX-1 system adenine-specific DNA-methyltransferase PglX, partial [Bacteroidales bacterium]|nr:BREX-1 system adenine-specific DNA-methyltransferase PglX [Bacteroidales bacterium]